MGDTQGGRDDKADRNEFGLARDVPWCEIVVERKRKQISRIEVVRCGGGVRVVEEVTVGGVLVRSRSC